MSTEQTLAAEIRDRAGKGAARAARREGRVPAVIYGDKKDPVTITLLEKDLMKQLHTGNFFSTVYSLEIDGGNETALPRDVQFHPVTDRPEHVDFLRIGKGATVSVEVTVHFINEDKSPGLKKGGVLNVVRHEVEVTAPATAIPDEIVIDVSKYEIGDSIHISEVELPEKVTPTITDRDFTIATIAAPTVAPSEDEDGEEAEAEAAEAEDEGGEDEDKGED